jgi:hypothetical protein
MIFVYYMSRFKSAHKAITPSGWLQVNKDGWKKLILWLLQRPIACPIQVWNYRGVFETTKVFIFVTCNDYSLYVYLISSCHPSWWIDDGSCKN